MLPFLERSHQLLRTSSRSSLFGGGEHASRGSEKTPGEDPSET